jgi:glycine cleavage system P protein (glycine dehydrogenase) subunit 1
MRYTPHTGAEIRQMLDSVGLKTVDELFRSIPREVQDACKLDLPEALSEMEAAELIEDLARGNYDPSSVACFLGGGAYDHYVPAVVGQLLSRSEFYTSYTPYQAEVSQGTLQAIYEYQSLICRLTGMDIANASGYDGASVIADAAMMACQVHLKREVVLVSETVNPAYRKVLDTYCSSSGHRIETVPAKNGATDGGKLRRLLNDKAACLILQQPNFYGVVEDIAALGAGAGEAGALLVVAGDPIGLGILKPPGETGVDVAVGEGQALGVPLSYGGPYLGYFATRDKYKRRIPGRIVGKTEDSSGRPGYVLTLQTREQHIRREKATSNICTNQALVALAATIYLALTGKQGLRKVAELCLQKAHYLAEQIAKLPGWSLSWPEQPFFREFAVNTPLPPEEIIERMLQKKFLAGIDLGRFDEKLAGKMLVSVTERRTRAQIDSFVEALGKM